MAIFQRNRIYQVNRTHPGSETHLHQQTGPRILGVGKLLLNNNFKTTLCSLKDVLQRMFVERGRKLENLKRELRRPSTVCYTSQMSNVFQEERR